MPISKKRLAEIAAIADEDIDTSDIPEADEEFFKKAKLTVPSGYALPRASTHVVDNSTRKFSVPAVSVTYAQTGSSTKANALGMRPMQERAYERRGEQYLLIKSPPASGKSRALMFIALDKLHNQGLKQAIIVVPEKAIGASFHDEPLSQVRLLGRLDRRSRNGTSATRPARTMAARSIRSAPFSTATTRCWSAPMRPSASPWTGSAWRRSTIG